jgi:hypothetical protein
MGMYRSREHLRLLMVAWTWRGWREEGVCGAKDEAQSGKSGSADDCDQEWCGVVVEVQWCFQNIKSVLRPRSAAQLFHSGQPLGARTAASTKASFCPAAYSIRLLHSLFAPPGRTAAPLSLCQRITAPDSLDYPPPSSVPPTQHSTFATQTTTPTSTAFLLPAAPHKPRDSQLPPRNRAPSHTSPWPTLP